MSTDRRMDTHTMICVPSRILLGTKSEQLQMHVTTLSSERSLPHDGHGHDAPKASGKKTKNHQKNCQFWEAKVREDFLEEHNSGDTNILHYLSIFSGSC